MTTQDVSLSNVPYSKAHLVLTAQNFSVFDDVIDGLLNYSSYTIKNYFCTPILLGRNVKLSLCLTT
jgi:hypothetical protein